MPTDRTFLFTDIEGSTRILRELGDQYAEVLERHRTLIESAIATNGGSIVDRSGDELFAAFLDSSGAVAGAVAAQLALAAEPWPDGARVNVRMGLHRGRVQATGGGFVGLAVHQAARVCQTARGGEILISDSVETEAETLDLGEFELRGIPRATRLRRVLAPGLQTLFPPLPGSVPRPAPMRVVLADDSVLLREGIASLLEDAGFEVVGQAGERRRTARARGRDAARAWPSSTSGCRRPTTTRAFEPRTRSAAAIHRPACSSSRPTSTP